MFNFESMELSYTARMHRQDEEATCDVGYLIDQAIEWMSETKEGRLYFFEAVNGYDEYHEEIDKLLGLAIDTGPTRNSESYIKMGQHMSVFVKKWINRVGKDDYKKIADYIG